FPPRRQRPGRTGYVPIGSIGTFRPRPEGRRGMTEPFYTDDHEKLREVVRTYVEREVAPNLARWERQRLVDREAWLAAGRQGLLGARVPEEYGGAGLDDYRVRCVIAEEMARVGAASVALGFALNDDIVLPYL